MRFNEVGEVDLGVYSEMQPSETIKALLCSLNEVKTENELSEFGGVNVQERCPF